MPVVVSLPHQNVGLSELVSLMADAVAGADVSGPASRDPSQVVAAAALRCESLLRRLMDARAIRGRDRDSLEPNDWFLLDLEQDLFSIEDLAACKELRAEGFVFEFRPQNRLNATVPDVVGWRDPRDSAADYVATIRVPAAKTFWPADEVPHRTADALYRFEPEPDPVVTTAEIRRFISADLRNRDAGQTLNARELANCASKCKAAGLPEMHDGLPYSKWGEYLEAFNHDAESRGWWAGLIPPSDPHQAERLSWSIAADEHRKLLKAAIASGEIQARMAGTMVPAAPGIVSLERLVLTREGLEAFAARLAMKVVDMPHFITSARPLEVPAAASAAAPRGVAAPGPAKAHVLKSRVDPLAAVLTQARAKALDPADWQSGWAALVALAQLSDRPAPLLGYSEGEGVKYQKDSAIEPVGWLTREAYRKRHNRRN